MVGPKWVSPTQPLPPKHIPARLMVVTQPKVLCAPKVVCQPWGMCATLPRIALDSSVAASNGKVEPGACYILPASATLRSYTSTLIHNRAGSPD